MSSLRSKPELLSLEEGTRCEPGCSKITRGAVGCSDSNIFWYRILIATDTAAVSVLLQKRFESVAIFSDYT